MAQNYDTTFVTIDKSRRSVGWCFVYHNYQPEDIERILALEDFKYCIMGEETCPETGTPHLQGFMQLPAPGRSWNNMQVLIGKVWMRATRGTILENITYCSKDKEFHERGERPMSQEEKGKRGADKIKDRWDSAKKGRYEDLPPEQVRTYEYIHRKYMPSADRSELDNEWIFGISGCGKSRGVRQRFGDTFYTKPMSKWWDGYNGQEVVLIDDFDPSHAPFLSYYLKIWCDYYKFNAEVKCGMMQIRPKKIIVTSQYSIEQCFQDPKTVEALTRRFKIIEIDPSVAQRYDPHFNPPPPDVETTP